MVGERMKVLVYGASGERGGPVGRRLLEAEHEVRVVARNPANAQGRAILGADVVGGNLGDKRSLEKASAGVDAVFLHLPLGYDRAMAATFVRNAVDAAVAGGATRLVFQGNNRYPDRATDAAGFEIDRDAAASVHDSRIDTVVFRPTV